MASPFQRYQSGIEASTGNLVQAYGQMAGQTANAIAGLGQSLAQGLQQYNENSQKSEAANAKIQMLGQAYADKIAMYSKDPEIAQSGILDSLMNKAALLQEAPTKGLSQRVMIAHEAETALAGFGNQLQEWSFLRGREMERQTDEGLRRFAGETSVTSPRFSKAEEFKADPNLTLEENKAKALSYLNRVRALNPKLQGTDQEFLASWLTTAEQDIAKADPTKVPPAVISTMLEQIQADKRIQKSNAEAAKTGLVEDFLAKGKKSSRADFEKTMTSAADVLAKQTESAKNFAPSWLIEKAKEEKGKMTKSQAELKSAGYVILDDTINKLLEKAKAGEPVTTESIMKLLYNSEVVNNPTTKPIVRSLAFGGAGAGFPGGGFQTIESAPKTLSPASTEIKNALLKLNKKADQPLTSEEILSLTTKVAPKIDEFKKASEKLTEQSKNIKLADEQKIAPIPIGEVVLGSMEETRKRTVAERQREVADFVTSRMGAIDPTDPERKRRLPVAGFDKFYKTLVPEAEIREFTTDGGIRMVHANGKWEQVKAADPMTIQDIRKNSIGIYGQQNAQGGFTPTEFVEDSGVYIGGVFKGTDSANDKYSDEMTQLIDARRSVKELQRINDLVGESLMPVEQGRALVEQMNLSAMLRTDIVGVGTVSNYEQQLIAKVIKDPTAFFSFESKDRAILVALAQRVDRRIKAISASKGLTVKIRDDSGSNKYQALREQYLKEKGIL